MQTFKPGDWVVEIHSEEIHQIIELFPDVCRVIKPISKITYSAEHTDFKPWQPLPGEWCWFWDNFNNPFIGKFVARDGDNYQYKHTKNDKVYSAYKCEPFVGELPSFLKETNNATN